MKQQSANKDNCQKYKLQHFQQEEKELEIEQEQMWNKLILQQPKFLLEKKRMELEAAECRSNAKLLSLVAQHLASHTRGYKVRMNPSKTKMLTKLHKNYQK